MEKTYTNLVLNVNVLFSGVSMKPVFDFEVVENDSVISDLVGGMDELQYIIQKGMLSWDAGARYNEEYVRKIGNRTVQQYTNTLTELTSCIATNLYKVEHNAILLLALDNAGVMVDKNSMVKELSGFYVKISTALEATADKPHDYFGEGNNHLVYVHGDESGILEKTDFKNNFGSLIVAGHHEHGRYNTLGLQPRSKRNKS